MSWHNDVVLEFLELYRNEQILWEPKHPLHRNRSEVNDAWLRVQSTLSISCSVADLKRKKESLMTSFRVHFNRKRRTAGKYNPTWFAYPLMESFLGGKYECDSTNQMDNDNEFYNHEGYSQISPADHNSRNVNMSDRNRQYKAQSTPQNVNYEKNCTNKISNNQSYSDSDAKKDFDEYELYGQLLAKKLRKLDEHQRDVAMHDIDNIMFRAKMQSGASQTRNYSLSPSPVPRKTKSPIFIVAPQTQYEDENTPYQEHMQPQAPS